MRAQAASAPRAFPRARWSPAAPPVAPRRAGGARGCAGSARPDRGRSCAAASTCAPIVEASSQHQRSAGMRANPRSRRRRNASGLATGRRDPHAVWDRRCHMRWAGGGVRHPARQGGGAGRSAVVAAWRQRGTTALPAIRRRRRSGQGAAGDAQRGTRGWICAAASVLGRCWDIPAPCLAILAIIMIDRIGPCVSVDTANG
jgi:hypothetical protein